MRVSKCVSMPYTKKLRYTVSKGVETNGSKFLFIPSATKEVHCYSGFYLDMTYPSIAPLTPVLEEDTPTPGLVWSIYMYMFDVFHSKYSD